MDAVKLKTLNITEYNLIANKDPFGNYDRKTRENLYWVIEKLRANVQQLSSLESRIFAKFQTAEFGALKDKEKKVKFEIAWFRLSDNFKRSIKIAASAFSLILISGFTVYQFILDAAAQQKVEIIYYSGLNKLGLASSENIEKINNELQQAKLSNKEANLIIEEMILNNQITENLKYILKQIYNDSRANYVKKGNKIVLEFNGKKIAQYKWDPSQWYLLGIVKSGVTRVFYNNEEILQFRTIFGRKGEETPLGEYEIKNRAYKPTWYKKEKFGDKIKVRAIPFGHPDHEIGYWWMGLKKIGDPVRGSYGIHGVNAGKINEFYKKNFDWRNGSAGCPNIESWYLHFLAKVLPLGVHVNIVDKDKWTTTETPFVPPSSA